MTGRRVVLAQDPDGQFVAVGPVRLDEAVTALRDAVEDAGWTDRGPAPYLSAAEFRTETATVRETTP